RLRRDVAAHVADDEASVALAARRQEAHRQPAAHRIAGYARPAARAARRVLGGQGALGWSAACSSLGWARAQRPALRSAPRWEPLARRAARRDLPGAEAGRQEPPALRTRV